MNTPTLTHIDYLHNRGIADATISTYRIQALAATEKYPRPAIKYPTIDSGAQMYRAKYIDGAKPKNIWLGQKPDGKFTLYDAGGLHEAIKELYGACWWLNGEPAVWAFHSFRIARQHDGLTVAPATCLMGEGRGLSDFEARRRLVNTLTHHYGIKQLHVVIDTDKKGVSSAYRLYRTIYDPLRPVDMRVHFYQLPFEHTENNGRDFNDLWLDMGCDAERVAANLNAARIPDVDTAWRWFREYLGDEATDNIDADFEVDAMTHQERQERKETTKRTTAQQAADAKWNEYLDALTQAWESEFHYRHGYKTDGWSKKNVRNHWRGEKDASAGYNCKTGVMVDFGGDTYDAKELGAKLGLEWPFEDKAATPNISKAQLSEAPAWAGEPTAMLQSARWVSSKEASSLARRYMSGDVHDVGEPLAFPLHALRRFGGLCKTLPAGKMVGIAGGTGNGKTALNETMIDAFNRNGIDTLTYSPEWLPVEIQHRRIQRYSYTGEDGLPFVDYTMMQDDIMYSKDVEIGVNAQFSDGVRLTAAQQKEVDRVLKTVDSWAGVNYCAIQTSKDILYLETLLEMIADMLSDQRKQKRRTAIFLDYLQLAEVRESNNNSHVIQQAILQIKRHVDTHQYIPFVTSQVTKQAQKDGELIEASDAQYLRADQFNLFLTINREFDEIYDNGVKVRKYKPAAKLYVDKNSVSVGQSYLRMPLNLARLSWVDEEIQP